MFGRGRKVHHDPELCRQIEEKDLTRELLADMDRGYRHQRAKRSPVRSSVIVYVI